MVRKIFYFKISKLLQDDRIKTIEIDNISTTFNRIELLTVMSAQVEKSVTFVKYNLFLADKENHIIMIKGEDVDSDTVGVTL